VSTPWGSTRRSIRCGRRANCPWPAGAGQPDPLLLLAGGSELELQGSPNSRSLRRRPHVFNLGHGIDKETPIAHVERLLAAVRGWRG
jgi:uroporphyrinogen-III decarboxylase